jgi:uncharacterized protein (TIGR00369 family)
VPHDDVFDTAIEAFHRAQTTASPDFERFFLARFYGLDFEYTDDTCIVNMAVHDYMLNPQGSLHGGVISFVLDVAMGHLLQHVSGPGVTLGMNIQYLRSSSTGMTRSESRFIKRGRSISFLEAQMIDEAGSPLAAATATWKLL